MNKVWLLILVFGDPAGNTRIQEHAYGTQEMCVEAMSAVTRSWDTFDMPGTRIALCTPEEEWREKRSDAFPET